MPRHPETVITPNRLLTKARERLWSPFRPGQRLSRAELADAVNAALDQLYPGRDISAHYVDFRWVGKLERGEHNWSSDERRAALRHVLGAATDAELGLYNPRRTPDTTTQRANPLPSSAPGRIHINNELVPTQAWLWGHPSLASNQNGSTADIAGRADETVTVNHGADGGLQVGVEATAYIAARESWEHLAMSGYAVDDAAIEQAQVQVRRLAHYYHELSPIRLLSEARHTRDLTYRLLERTKRPGQMTDLYLVAGQACGLLAMASFDLAQWDAATDQIRAAEKYAGLIDHASLRSWSVGTGALIAYWTGRPHQAVAELDNAIATSPPGVATARLGAILARAWSYLAKVDEVLVVLEEADRAMDAADGNDELYDAVGGELGWGRSIHHACAGTALLHVGRADAATRRIRTALQAAPGDPHGGLVPLRAHVDLAAAELAAGRLDAAEDALAEVWSTPAQWRRHGLTARLEQVGHTLADPTWRDYRPAVELRDRIEVFVTEAIATRALPPA